MKNFLLLLADFLTWTTKLSWNIRLVDRKITEKVGNTFLCESFPKVYFMQNSYMCCRFKMKVFSQLKQLFRNKPGEFSPFPNRNRHHYRHDFHQQTCYSPSFSRSYRLNLILNGIQCVPWALDAHLDTSI